MTALWKSFEDNHDSHTFYVTFERENKFRVTGIEAVSKKGRDKRIIGNPVAEFTKGWVPLNIFEPETTGTKKTKAWLQKAAADLKPDENVKFSNFLEALKNKISNTNIPYFLLQQTTSKGEAINIFIETNISAIKLTDYDLAVARIEDKTAESLRQKVYELTREVPIIGKLEGTNSVGDLVLKIQCIFDDKKPTYGNYKNLDYSKLISEWNKIVEGIKWATEILGELHIWDSVRLPTAVPLRVLPALHHLIPKSGHPHAKALRLIRKYIWWSFLTDRYERQANDRLKEDHDALVDLLQKKQKEESHVPVFRSEMPKRKDLISAGWPKKRGIRSRAILVACSLDGARDITSNEKLKQDDKRDYHHIFPKTLLKGLNENPDLSLNCMLLEPPSNKEWAKKWPGDFLLEAIQASQFAGNPEAEVKKRLNTHLVPTDHLIAVKENSGVDFRKTYEEFLGKRAEMVMERIEKLLADGEI